MKPDDRNGAKAPEDRPFRVLIIAASNRRQYDCPGIDSKARALMFRMADRLAPGMGDRPRGSRQRLEPGTDPHLQRLRLDLDGALRLALQLLQEGTAGASPT
jgi:hypothetical protein